MPHATMNHPFEWKVLEFAGRLSRLLAGNVRRGSFVVTFDPEGSARSVTFECPDEGWHELTKRLDAEGVPHLFFDPFDAPEYTWVAWSGLSQSTMERLIGAPFEPGAFEPFRAGAGRGPALDPPGTFPTSWGVMF